MSTTRIHHSLPAPVIHAGFSLPQSKSHVLAGVQDAYWSDDEAEDAECPLCLEEMDISDLNFKPCICGYQICRFCWHHIKENLNKRCPACRRVYTDEAVEFKPIATQDHKRLTQQKKQREREKKELDALGRRQLANVRVVQRNIVYVVGIGPRFAKEELIPTLRSSEYFGQYGKITKILLVKRTPSGGGAPVVGVYITYHRREDAARAISAVDGTSPPGGGREPMRASYGTTKYCMTFLRGLSCNDHGCMNLHEWGDEKDCFTKEDLTTLKHTMKATESRSRAITTPKKTEESDALPRGASWAQKGNNAANNSSSTIAGTYSTPGLLRQSRRNGTPRLPRITSTISPATISGESRHLKPIDRKAAVGTVPFTTSRPSTPGSSNSVPSVSAGKSGELLSEDPSTERLELHVSSPTDYSKLQGSIQGQENSLPVGGIPSSQSVVSTIPPGPSVPPGIPSLSRPPRAVTASPQTPLLASQSSYQMSTAARALLDDVKARRESAMPSSFGMSPFPDLDKTLQSLSDRDNGGFSFNFDPKLADEVDSSASVPMFPMQSSAPFSSTYVDPFPAFRGGNLLPSHTNMPTGLLFPQGPDRSIFASTEPASTSNALEKQLKGAGYVGIFNPFADVNEDNSDRPSQSPFSSQMSDDERKVSRFGFARGRQGSSVAPSPAHISSPLNNDNADDRVYYGDRFPTPSHTQWSSHGQQQDFSFAHNISGVSSPLVPHQAVYSGFHPFDGELSESQLQDFIQTSRERANLPEHQNAPFKHTQTYNDPAILSASFLSPMQEPDYNPIAYGPPPGLPFPQHVSSNARPNMEDYHVSTPASSTSLLPLSTTDFPALTASTSENSPTIPDPALSMVNSSTSRDDRNQEREDRKAAKKAAAAERAADRQRIAQQKAAVKAAEKVRLAREKAEKAAIVLKTQQDKNVLESAEKETDPAREPTLCPLKVAPADQEVVLPGKNKLGKKSSFKGDAIKSSKRLDSTSSVTPKIPTRSTPTSNSHLAVHEPISQVPLLSKKPKKNKPMVKLIKVAKEEDPVYDDAMSIRPAPVSDIPHLPASTSSGSRSQSLDRTTLTSVEELLEEIDILNPNMDLPGHPFFDLQKVNPSAKTPLEYGPLVHALSALSVGGGSFANNMPSGSIDNAVSSFQQLLETLTQTISDLLRLLPRTTWDDSSSFDGVLRDMLKGDDFLDDAGDEGQAKEDEVAALTLALERRARWMEVQLSKLEELHRDINTAAVRAVLSFNDNGWDRHGFLPRIGTTLRRFDDIGMVDDGGILRPMNADELEEKLAVAKDAAFFAETQVREAMEKLQGIKVL